MDRQQHEMATTSGSNTEINATSLEHYGSDLRAYFRANPNSCNTLATLEFLDRFGPYRWQQDFEDCTYEQLSFGSNDEGDIFSIIAEVHNPTNTRIFRYNIFNQETIELSHVDVPAPKNSADIAYEHSGGSSLKRRLDTVIDDQPASLILSVRGNRYVTSDSDQPLSDCRLLNHQIRYDQKRQVAIARTAIAHTTLAT